MERSHPIHLGDEVSSAFLFNCLRWNLVNVVRLRSKLVVLALMSKQLASLHSRWHNYINTGHTLTRPNSQPFSVLVLSARDRAFTNQHEGIPWRHQRSQQMAKFLVPEMCPSLQHLSQACDPAEKYTISRIKTKYSVYLAYLTSHIGLKC